MQSARDNFSKFINFLRTKKISKQTENVDFKNSLHTRDELLAIVEDTLSFVLKDDSVDIYKMYSKWSSQEELIDEVAEHLESIHDDRPDWTRLNALYAPTVGLCEIAVDTDTYMSLAARFDKVSETTKHRQR